MGTTSQKLTYLNTTKQDIKQAINNLGGDITSSTTFRNYATELNDIYNNLPKVSDTGTNVSLNPTLKGRLGIVPKGNTLQDGEPTPDTPVEIQSATGTQKVVVSGKNLFDENYPSLSEALKYLPIYVGNGTFTMSSNVPENVVVGASLFFLTGNVTSGASTSANGVYKDRPITINSTNGYVTVAYRNYNDPNNYDTQLEKGNTATPYQPYQEPQEVDIELGNIELNKIGDYEDYIGGTPDNWILYKNIGKIVLNGSISFDKQDAWSNVGNNTNAFYKGYTAFDNMKPNSVVMSDNFVYLSNIVTNDSYGIYLTTNLIIRVPKTITNKSELNNWLSTHNVEIIYLLATPTETPITEEPLVSQLNELHYLMSNDDTTNIDVTGNLPMRITASAIKGE